MKLSFRLRLAPATAVVFFATTTTVASAQQHAAPPHAEPAKVAPPAPPASPSRAAALAWAKARNLPVREIEVGPADRRVKRLFVPVTADRWPSFLETFSTGPRSLMLKLKSDNNHLMVVVDEKFHLWARHQPGLSDWGYGRDGPNGPAMIVDLAESESRHVRQWFTHRAKPEDSLWQCGSGCMDFIGNVEVAPGPRGENQLRTIGADEINGAAGQAPVKGGQSTKVPVGKKLFDVLGVARSKDGRNMTYNMIHAANERVQVVGIPVGPDEGGGLTEKRVIRENGRVFVRDVTLFGAAIERFTKMTDAELLGPLPPQGVDGVARPVK
jgi:hypothetical protein